MRKRYNHAYTVAFSLESGHEDGYDVDKLAFTNAVLQRVLDLNKHDEWDEAVGAPFDTYEVSNGLE